MSGTGPVKFGSFTVTKQVFYRSKLSYGLVNLKPILPGHVLVCPLRHVERFGEMTAAENADFFDAVRKVSKAIELKYKADALNITIQDGALAGQSVAHVHCHIIPRRLNDLPNGVEMYDLLDSKDADLETSYKILKEHAVKPNVVPDSESRDHQTEEQMAQQAAELAKFMAQLQDKLED